jgi:hypothetical protein
MKTGLLPFDIDKDVQTGLKKVRFGKHLHYSMESERLLEYLERALTAIFFAE